MHAEYPPNLDIVREIEPIALFDPVDCSMWRMGQQCLNTADQALICEDSQGRRFALAQCQMCLDETQRGIMRIETVVQNQQITNQVLAMFEFNSEYQQRIPMSDILGSLKIVGRANEMRVAAALKAHGAIKERTSAGARWNGLRWRS